MNRRGSLLQHSLHVNSSSLNINTNISSGTSENGGIRAHTAGWGVTAWLVYMWDLTWHFFKRSKWEAKNLFHLGAIKWIPESVAPARRRGFFFFSWFYYPFPLPCASRRNAHFSLTKPHFQCQNHTGTTVIKCKPVLPLTCETLRTPLSFQTLEKCCVLTFMWSN